MIPACEKIIVKLTSDKKKNKKNTLMVYFLIIKVNETWLLWNPNTDAIPAVFRAGTPQTYSLLSFSPPCLSKQLGSNHNPPPSPPPPPDALSFLCFPVMYARRLAHPRLFTVGETPTGITLVANGKVTHLLSRKNTNRISRDESKPDILCEC